MITGWIVVNPILTLGSQCNYMKHVVILVFCKLTNNPGRAHCRPESISF